MEKVTANQAAKLLDISVEKLEILEKQGLIHSTVNTEGVSSYSAEEIARIKSRHVPTLAEEAAQVGSQILNEVVSSVSAHRKVLMLAGGALSGFVVLVVVFAILFTAFPLQTSDFFGYFYRYNTASQKISLSSEKEGNVLAASTTAAGVVPNQTSILADIIKPVAAASLVAVKAVDNQKYTQIVTNPVEAAGLGGQAGSPGPAGANGANGADGQPGTAGPQGVAGLNGTNGTNGSNGSNGTSVADVLTTAGSIIIRDGTNTTVPLSAGSNGQVLTISGGIPAWENSSTTATNFSGSLLGDVTGTQGATVLKNTGTAGTYGSALSIPVLTTDAQGRVLGVSNTTISGLTNSNLSGSAGITNANLANSSITFSTGTAGSDFNISGTPSLGGTLTLNIPNASASNRGLLTSTDWSAFNGKQNALGYTPLNSASNLSDLTSASTARTNLGLGTLAVQSGTFSGTSSGTNTGDQTNITGNAGTVTNGVYTTGAGTIFLAPNGSAASLTSFPTFNQNTTGNALTATTATNFSGSLSGDVTGTQGATVLKNTGTAGTYGSVSNIPVFVTDAQGRVTSVTNTAISGLTVSSFGSANISQWTNNSGYLTSEADTLASVTGRGTTTTTALTLSSLSNAITAGTLTATGGTINGTTIGATSPSTGVFTTINGLTISNNGTNTLTIAAGKILTVNNSITFGGTDGTTFTLPATSDTLVGRNSADTLTNKTIAAGSNTITGLTNSNLSGTAGITNGNLANSSITTAGNSGSGSVSLGGGLTFTGSGITNIVASGSTLTITSTEADTLQSVYNRGNTIPTTTGATANTIDSATINVGNIASTAQQNFSTLNITNGGTGYLDLELVRGFINFQGMNTFYDDFTDRVLNTTNRWTTTASGGGSTCSILAGGLNGLLRMVAGTGGANRACELTTQAVTTLTNGFYQRGNNPIFETKVTLNSLTSDIAYAGFTDTRVTVGSNTNASTNHAYFAKRSTDTNWQCVTDNGGATETYTDTGVAVSTGVAYRLRIELRNGTTPETICTVDNGTTVTRNTVTATQPGATSPMDIYLAVVVTANTTAKNMDVDYVRAWQDDPVSGLTIDNNSQQSSVDAASIDATPSAALPLEEKVASGSGSLTELVASSINNFFKNLVEFFGNVIFHSDVSFLGRPTFNKDTAGHAQIKFGRSEVSVVFDKEYIHNPVVTASINLDSSIRSDEIPQYAVYDLSTKEFKIKLSKATPFDLNFSWIALAVNGDNTSTSDVSGTPLPSPIPTVIPSATPSSTQEMIPSPTATESASPSAQVVP